MYWVITASGKHGCWPTLEQAQAQADGLLENPYTTHNDVSIMKEVATRKRTYEPTLHKWVEHE